MSRDTSQSVGNSRSQRQTSPPSRLCQVCDQIGTYDTRWFVYKPYDSPLGLAIYIHHRDLHSLIMSVDNGCRLCELVYSTVSHSAAARRTEVMAAENAPSEEATKEDDIAQIKWFLLNFASQMLPDIASLSFDFTGDIDTLHRLSLLCGRRRVILIGNTDTSMLPFNLHAVVLPDSRTQSIVGSHFELTARAGMKDLILVSLSSLMLSSLSDDASGFPITAWGVSPMLFTDQRLRRIRSWRERCLAEHPKCRETSGPQPLPSRVIDLSNAGTSSLTVKLRESRGESGTYAALSYCWGTCPQRTTTKSTLSEHLVDIQVSVLPATIQDAIRLCNSLQIPYLWVDSLCIVQDDSEDWRHEAAEMATIYGRAALTISTPQNSRCDEGFNNQWPTEPEYVPPPEILWEHRQPEKTVRRVVTAQACRMDDPQAALAKHNSPWMKRAWTLQEWLLSPRVLHCGNQIIWDCYQKWFIDHCSCPPTMNGALHKSDDTGHGLASHIFARMARLDPDIQGSALDTHWASLVEEYTSRTLSRETDKMPAIAGLAAKFMEHSHTKALAAKCIAGLWYYKGTYPFEGQKYPTSQIPLGLLWRRSTVEYMQSPAVYRAPSWSWAALDGPVSLFRPEWAFFDIFGDFDQFDEYKMMDVLAADCSYDPPDSFSLIQTGWITATGQLKRAHVNQSGKAIQALDCLETEYQDTFIELSTDQAADEIPWCGILDEHPDHTGIHHIVDRLYLLLIAVVVCRGQNNILEMGGIQRRDGENNPPMTRHALVVENVGSFDNIDCFRRLGVAWQSPKPQPPGQSDRVFGLSASERHDWLRDKLTEWEKHTSRVRLI